LLTLSHGTLAVSLTLRDPLAGRPLFIRIFALMVAAVLLAQVISFLVLLATPMPPPNLHKLETIAESLQGGVAGLGLDLSYDNKAPPNAGPRDRLEADRGKLIQMLGVDPNLVRLELRGPGGHDDKGPDGFIGLWLGDHPPPPRDSPQNPDHRPPAWEGNRPPPPNGDRPPPDWGPNAPPDNRGGDMGPPPRDEFDDDIIQGDFAAALKLPDGRWRVVQPAGGGLGGWYLRVGFWLFTAVAVVTPLAWWLARRLAGPVTLFAHAAERLGRDPAAPALDISGPPEVAAAARAFNRMQERLRRYVEDRTLMVGAIAHDLRTPLARLAFRLEEAPDHVREAAAQDLAEMREMVAAALAFVRDMSRPLERTQLDLRALVAGRVTASHQMGEPVSAGPLADAVVDGDGASLGRVIDNLIGNAVTYGETAQVSLLVEDGYAIVLVEDEGPGIPAPLLERVFEPFFRVEPSRNRHTGGTGLGLASARAVVLQHGGEIRLANRPAGGLCARVMLPLANSIR
jgi:signal transduction histidine kinase